MRRVQKPIRLYVLTIFIVVAYGIMPFISAMPYGRGFILFGLWNLPLNGSIYFLYGPNGESSLAIILISLLLCAFSAASAIWAFYGDKEGRIATLAFVTLNVLWWTALVIFAIAGNDLPPQSMMRLAIEPIPPLFWLGFIWWNYTRADVNEFYAYRSSLEQ